VDKTTTSNNGRLLELLNIELGMLGQIRALMEKQTEFLLDDDTEAFDALLDKKDEIIRKIKGLHQETAPLMQSYISSNNSNEKIDGLKAKLKKEVAFCAELNMRHVADMNDKSEELSKELEEKRSKREGIGGYVQAVPVTSEKFDNKA